MQTPVKNVPWSSFIKARVSAGDFPLRRQNERLSKPMSTRRTNWFISGQTAKKSLQRRDIHSILLSRAGQRPVNSTRVTFSSLSTANMSSLKKSSTSYSKARSRSIISKLRTITHTTSVLVFWFTILANVELNVELAEKDGREIKPGKKMSTQLQKAETYWS